MCIHDTSEVLHRPFQVVVHNHVISNFAALRLLGCPQLQAGPDELLPVPAPAHSPLQFLPRRRKHENHHGVGIPLSDLLRAADVDLQDHVLVVRWIRQGRAHEVVRKQLDPLEKAARVAPREERFTIDERVRVIRLAGSLLSRCP